MMASRGAVKPGSAGGPARHVPVMLREVLSQIAAKSGGQYLDATFGAGGYTRALLEAADCRVIALDRDPAAVASGAPLVEQAKGRLVIAEERFSRLDAIARELARAALDGIVLDLGVSSMQLEEAERGFSFRHDGPLDMRMERQGPSAADVVNYYPETELARAIATLGEERRARAVARAIVTARKKRPLRRTGELAEIVREVVPGSKGGIDPATRTFQALRVLVNDELFELAAALTAAERALKPGGRLVVVSFHSLEDRLVKTFLTARGRAAPVSRHRPEAKSLPPTFRLITRKPLVPSPEEIAQNPRARSAKLRAAERTDAPVRADEPLANLIARLPSLEAALGRR
jgi:16S rRNA (cytosine1402-N4)-methyltransferase